MVRRALPIVDVPDPCDVPSSEMVKLDEEGRVLACHQCQHNVYDLSKLTTDEAFTLLDRHEGSLCVQFYARADGTVQTIDCAPSRFEALRKRASRVTRAAMTLVAGVFALLIGLVQVRAHVGSHAEFTNVETKRPKPVHKPKPVSEPQPVVSPPVVGPRRLVRGRRRMRSTHR